MKCDHIRTRAQGDAPFFPNMLNNSSVEVCLKEDVDAAIDELKTEHHKERDEYISMVHSREQTIKELKQKLENVQASMYADVVDVNMENRRLKRALFIALAYKAKYKKYWYCELLNQEGSKIRPDNNKAMKYNAIIKICQKCDVKCRAKAEGYK